MLVRCTAPSPRGRKSLPLTGQLSASSFFHCLISLLALHDRKTRCSDSSRTSSSRLQKYQIFRRTQWPLTQNLNSFARPLPPKPRSTASVHSTQLSRWPPTRQNQQCHRRPKPCIHSSLPSPQRRCMHTYSTTFQLHHQTPSQLSHHFSRRFPHLHSFTASDATKTTPILTTGTAHVMCHMTMIALLSSGPATNAVTATMRHTMVAAARLLRARATSARQTDGAT